MRDLREHKCKFDTNICSIAVGIGVSGALTAASSLAGGIMNSNAQNSAAQQQIAQENKALALQQQMFGQETSWLQPYQNAGTGALNTLQNYPNFNFAPTQANLQAYPGYQFALQQGELATKNSNASQGLGNSGALDKGLEQYASGLAAQNYGNFFNQSLQSYQTNLGREQNLAGIGLNAAGSLANAANNNALNQGQIYQNIGQAQAQGTLGSTAALTQGINGFAGAAGQALLMGNYMGGNGIYGGGNNSFAQGAAYGSSDPWAAGPPMSLVGG